MTFHRTAIAAVLAAALLATPAPAQAATSSPASAADDRARVLAPLGDLATASLDVREALPRLAPTGAQRAAVSRLGTADVAWNDTLGTPRVVEVEGGSLTGPRDGSPLAIARDWLRTHSGLFGLPADFVADLSVVRDHELPGIGAHVLSFEQTFGGVAAGFGGVLTVVVDRDGRVVRYAGNPVRSTTLRGDFTISPGQAISSVVDVLAPALDFVATALGRRQAGYDTYAANGLADVVRLRRIAFPMADGGHAAYAVLVVKSLDEAWVEIVDAGTGRTLLRKSLVQHADGTVYENYPGAPRGGKPVRRSFGRTPQSPAGWTDPTGLLGTGVTTLGNNANTAAGWTVPLVPVDQALRPFSPTGEFHHPFPASWTRSNGAPLSYQADTQAAVVNLFYHHNRIHDEFYEFGFTETGGNFQLDNFGKGGLGGDPVFGGAQSGALGLTDPVLGLGRNNANMLTLPDGIPGITNMYLWNPVDDAFEGEYRDGDFDSTIIHHEYAHGLTNRYVGGGGLGALGTTQGGAMGEGWGDWFAMNHLFREGLTRTAVTAPYVGDPQRGIRNWNYARSPATYGDYGYDLSGPEVHSDGEIWTATLWSVRAAILRAVGGNQARASDVAEHLVMDAMPISPAEPSFLDMRDAILAASRLRYGRTYTDLLWRAFAERGMGASARTRGEADTDPRPGFDHRDRRRNGKVVLRLRNASTGGPVRDARVLGGLFEARATPIATTSRSGRAAVRMVSGRHTLTIQAPGFGIQRFRVPVRSGETTRRTLRLRPNLLSERSGATVVRVSSENPALPATNLLDDSETSAWQTADRGTAYVAGRKQSVTVRMKKQALVQHVAVSVMKPPTLPRFAAADKVRVETSLDGKRWRHAVVASYSFRRPRPTVNDQMLRTYALRTPVRARYVRATALSTFGDGPTTTTAIVAEVQAFGKVRGIRPTRPKPDAPVTSSGSVAVGNPAQGSLLGLDPYKPGATDLSWPATCPGLPAANGTDAWLTRLPKGAADGRHTITYEGSVPLGEWQLWWYGPDCQPITGGFALVDEPEVIPPGAAYAGFLLLYGAGASFDVVVREPR